MTAVSLPYVVIVSDGVSIRTLHAPAFGPDLPALEAIVRRALGPAPVDLTPSVTSPTLEAPAAPAPKPIGPSATATLRQREIATASGYTGDCCQTCGGFAMRRTGTCLTCEACGSTSGGCS